MTTHFLVPVLDLCGHPRGVSHQKWPLEKAWAGVSILKVWSAVAMARPPCQYLIWRVVIFTWQPRVENRLTAGRSSVEQCHPTVAGAQRV